MRVRRVDILSTPGIEAGFYVDSFGDGLTIIEGRNESGKSTLAGAIRELLWPGRHTHLQARSTFEDRGREFHSFVDLHGGGWQGEAPLLPDPSAGRGMIVGISDLWHEDDHDQAVREAMARELQGGYDLSPLRAKAERKSPTAPMRDAREAERALSDARNAARALMAQEARLPELREQAAECRDEASRGELVKTALGRLDLLATLAADRNELDAMPEGAIRVTGTEARRLKELREAIADAKASADREQRAATKAREAIEGLGLAGGGVPEGDLHLLGELANEALAVERQIGDARREADRAQAEVEAMGGDAVPMGADKLARLDQALDAVQRTRERQNVDREAVEGWTPKQAEAPNKVLPAAVAVIALLTAIAALLAAAWIAVGLAVITAAFALADLIRRPAPPIDPMPQLRQRAEQSERAHAEAIARLREITGEDSELQSTLSLVTAAKRAERQDKLVRDLHAARAGVESLQQQLADLLLRARSVLGTSCDSTDELSRSLADLRHKSGEHRRLRGIESEAIERQAESGSRARKAQGDYEAFLEYLKLTEDRLSELQEWLRLRERAQTLAGQIRANEAVLERIEASLAGSSNLRELDKPTLESLLEACRAAGSEADALYREIGEIEGAVKRARHGADIEQAIAGYERAAEAVAEARDHECAKAARRLILDHASTGMEREDMPALLKSADDLMATFTNKAYGLTVNAESQPVVRDHRTGMVKAYDQLSTGTRAQALLAMRLASAMEAERRASASALPLVLDEPLATTDDERFEVIAKAMFALAGDGRQLIYLTCEPAHAERLQRLAASHGLDCIRHDLDTIRGRQRTHRNPASSLVEPKPMPSPERLSREAYLEARGVERLNPWSSSDAIDLFHVLPNNLTTLHELDQSGLRTVGQVLAEQRRLGDAFAWPEVARSADIATRLVQAWRKGRARPLTAQDLIDSGAVTDSFLERFAELNHDLGGSATKLMEAIEERADDRVKGFRSDKARALRDYLESTALLPIEPPMDRAELLHKALSGLDMSLSTQDRDKWLAMANHLLDQLDAIAQPDREAPAHLEA